MNDNENNYEQPVQVDHPRTLANEELDREILEDFGAVEPLDEQLDQWCEMPVRMVWQEDGGLQIELGPYTFPERAVNKLVAALMSYYPALWAMEAAEPGRPDS